MRDYPRVGAVHVETHTLGASFTAEIIQANGEMVFQHGFEWGRSTAGGNSVTTLDKIYLGPLDGTKFTTTVTRGIDPKINHSVRAFVETGKFRVIGGWTTFKGTSSDPPVVDALVPATATWGDTISIKGKNFSYARELVDVYFSNTNQTQGVVRGTTDTLIRVQVPDMLNKIQTPLTISIGSQSVVSSMNFTLAPIEVSAVTPPTANSQTLITVTCTNLHPNDPYQTKVALSGTEVPLDHFVTKTQSQLQFRVPNSTPGGPVLLKITSGPLVKEVPNAFIRLP